MLQELKESNYICRLNFCTWLHNNYSKLNNIFWSHEAHLHLDGDISRYHCTLRVNRIKQLKYLTLILYQISVTKGVKFRFNLLLTGQYDYTI